MFKRIILGKVDLSGVPQEYKWYTVVTQFNYEEKYIENVQEAVVGTELEHLISEYYVPIKYTKEKIKLGDGATKNKIHKTKGALSNYVFIKCILTESLWNLLRGTTGIAVIPTVGGIPQWLSEEDVRNIKEKQKPEGFTEEELQKFYEKQNKKYHMNVNEGESFNEYLHN